MAAALRSVLHPLASDIDDDVLTFVADALRGTSGDDSVEVLCSYIPGYDGQTKAQQRTKAAAALMYSRTPAPVAPAGATGGGGGSTGALDALAKQVAAASLEGSRPPRAVAAPPVKAAAAHGASSIPAALRPAVRSLQALLPDLSDRAALYALLRCPSRSVEAAADYCLEHDVAAEVAEEGRRVEERGRAGAAARAEEARAEDDARRRVLDRYDERPDDKEVVYRPGLPQGEKRKKGEKVLAYVDGRAVFVKPGEKYVVEKAAELPAGTTVGPAGAASPIKIKRKGQGGASPGFL